MLCLHVCAVSVLINPGRPKCGQTKTDARERVLEMEIKKVIIIIDWIMACLRKGGMPQPTDNCAALYTGVSST